MILRLGQVLGVVSALACGALLAMFVFANPYSDQPLGLSTLGIVAFVGLLALLALVASLQGSPRVLLLVFLPSFVPFGLYMLGAPGIFKWVGIVQLGYVLAAALMWFARSERAKRGVIDRATLLLLLVLGSSAILADQEVVSPSGFSGTLERGTLESVEAAVVEGSVQRLQEIRSTLEEEMGRAEEGGRVEHGDRYLLAFVDWRLGQLLDRDEKKERKRLLKEAQRHVDVILESDPTDAEALALRGTALGDRIDGALSGMVLGPKASASLDRAAELAPDNPRVALQRGIGFFFTPKQFGGGAEQAETELRRALELFETGSVGDAWPYWGRTDALLWLGQVLAKAGKLEEARALYDEALILAPGHAWVQNGLLPALDK